MQGVFPHAPSADQMGFFGSSFELLATISALTLEALSPPPSWASVNHKCLTHHCLCRRIGITALSCAQRPARSGISRSGCRWVLTWTERRPNASRPAFPRVVVLRLPLASRLTHLALRLQLFERDIKRLEEAGCVIKRVAALEDAEEVHARHTALCNYELAQVHQACLAELGYHGDDWLREAARRGWPEAVLAAIQAGLAVDESAYRQAVTGMTEFRIRIDESLEGHGFDAWISPASVEGFPPRLEEQTTGDPAMNRPWSHSGSPVASVPTVGFEVEGCWLPTALQVVGRFGEDEKTLAVAGKLHGIFAQPQAGA